MVRSYFLDFLFLQGHYADWTVVISTYMRHARACAVQCASFRQPQINKDIVNVYAAPTD